MSRSARHEGEHGGGPTLMTVCCADMAEAVETAAAPEELSRAGPSSDALAAEADERREEELRKRSRDPPIVFTDIDVSSTPLAYH